MTGSPRHGRLSQRKGREMSLQVNMDKWDYQEAIKQVQKMLDDIEAFCVENNSNKVKIENIPSATDIVDKVWDCIK